MVESIPSREMNDVGYDEIPPAPSMVESMRAHGYTLPTAIADLIDNSIAAKSDSVLLDFLWAGADSWISVVDDGIGMTEKGLSEAMRMGSRSPLEEREPDDLGRFGLGLKTASLSQCRRLTVASKQSGSRLCVRRWDLDYLCRPDVTGWRLLRSVSPGSEERIAPLMERDRGTLVLWEVLDRSVGDARRDDRAIHNHFLRLVEDVERHLSMVFHRFLVGAHPRLTIIVNGNKLRPWDPFLVAHKASQTTPEESIALSGYSEPVRVRGYVLPHKDRLGEEEHVRASGPAGWNAQQGFYLYRNERLIVPGSWLGLGPGRGWTQEEHYKLARIRLDVPNAMDTLWQLDVKKSSAHPPPSIAKQLTGLAQKVRQDAREVFAHRGKYGRRSKKLGLMRPWKSVSRNGVLTYRIDRQHSVIAVLLSSIPTKYQSDVDAALSIIEETVPIQQIWLDAAERPEGVSPPFYSSGATRLRKIIQAAYEALRRSRKIDHAEAVGVLLSAQEFETEEAQAIIASLGDIE
ncbi:ATP-binding protein [soil metagenome]